MSGPHRIVAARCAAVPWRNGGGLTRELDARAGEGGGFDWRLSLADIDRDGPFSALPGDDRVFALLEGVVALRFGDDELRVATGDDAAPLCFPGEAAPHAALRGGPVRALNLMLARGRCAGAMRRAALAAGEAPDPGWVDARRAAARGAPAVASHLLVVAGGIEADGIRAGPGEALGFDGPPGHVRATEPSTVLQTLVLRLDPSPETPR